MESFGLIEHSIPKETGVNSALWPKLTGKGIVRRAGETVREMVNSLPNESRNVIFNYLTGAPTVFEDATGRVTLAPSSTGQGIQLQAEAPSGFRASLDPGAKQLSIGAGNFDLSGGYGAAPRQFYPGEAFGPQQPEYWGRVGFTFPAPSYRPNASEAEEAIVETISPARAFLNQELERRMREDPYYYRP